MAADWLRSLASAGAANSQAYRATSRPTDGRA
jgi:hypothetical protein